MTRMNGQYFGSVYHEIGSAPKAFRTVLLMKPVSELSSANTR